MKLNVKAFALAAGIIWALGVFVLTYFVMWSGGYLGAAAAFLEGVYPWYSISFVGSIAGLFWGFLDAFIGCAIFAWLYNKLAGKK